jgi:hypothetical protein
MFCGDEVVARGISARESNPLIAMQSPDPLDGAMVHVLRTGSRRVFSKMPNEVVTRYFPLLIAKAFNKGSRSYRLRLLPTVGTRQTISGRCRCAHSPESLQVRYLRTVIVTM